VNLTKSQRESLRAMFGGRCAYCGQELARIWHADHVEPVERQSRYLGGGKWVNTGKMYNAAADRLDNLMPACHRCNIHKGSFQLEDWRRMISDLPGVLQRSHAPYRHALRFGRVQEVSGPVEFYFETLREET
jgi:hypothetical protein